MTRVLSWLPGSMSRWRPLARAVALSAISVAGAVRSSSFCSSCAAVSCGPSPQAGRREQAADRRPTSRRWEPTQRSARPRERLPPGDAPCWSRPPGREHRRGRWTDREVAAAVAGLDPVDDCRDGPLGPIARSGSGRPWSRRRLGGRRRSAGPASPTGRRRRRRRRPRSSRASTKRRTAASTSSYVAPTRHCRPRRVAGRARVGDDAVGVLVHHRVRPLDVDVEVLVRLPACPGRPEVAVERALEDRPRSRLARLAS